MSEAIRNQLQKFDQSHLVQFWDELSSEAQASLQQQIEAIDLEQVGQLFRGHDSALDWKEIATQAQPPNAIRLGQPSPLFLVEDARSAGEEALRGGKIGMLLVAGGQGSRLGFDQPKGMFPIGPISGRTLFQMLCDRLAALGQKFGRVIPLYIMTSPATDKATREYFAREGYCGLEEKQIQFFCQGQMPAVDTQSGKILMTAKDEIALSPDGHGGIISALNESGCLQDADSRGIEHFYYAQIDNPLAELCDPLLLGYHLLATSQITTQVVSKRFAKEKVGNVVAIDGKVQIIEYSDLPDSVAEQMDADGGLRLWAGNIAIHVFELAFLKSISQHGNGLPFHRAIKKVSFLDEAGRSVSPLEPNATKFERFVFDLLPLADRALVVEGDASRVFAPVKNADGASVDTPELARQAILRLHQEWLEEAGARIDDGVRVEIHPRWALDEAEVDEKIDESVHFTADTFLM